MYIYITGCLIALITILVWAFIEYKLYGEIVVKVKDIYINLFIITLSYIGALFVFIFLNGILLEQHGDKTIFFKKNK